MDKVEHECYKCGKKTTEGDWGMIGAGDMSDDIYEEWFCYECCPRYESEKNI